MAGQDGADVTFEALQLVALATELMPFGVTAAKLRDCARAKRLQGAKNLTTAGGNAEHQGVLKAWSQSQVEELIQKLLQQKVLREEKESAGGKGKGGKGKWKAVKRLREGVNFEKFRNGDIVMSVAGREASEALRTPPPASQRRATEVEPGSPLAPKQKRLRKAAAEAMTDGGATEADQLEAPESPSAKSHKASEATAATGLVPIADASVEDTGKAAKAKASPKKRQSKARISGEEKAKSPTKRQSKAKSPTKRQSKAGNSLAQAAAEEDEEGWPPVHSDSSGEELVWIGGGHANASPKPRAKAKVQPGQEAAPKKPAEAPAPSVPAPPAPAPAAQFPLPGRPEAVQPCGAPPWTSSGGTCAPSLAVQVVQADATGVSQGAVSATEAPCGGRAIPWNPPNVEPQPARVPSRAALRNQLRVGTS